MIIQVLFKKKKKPNQLPTKSTCIIFFVKEENKLDYKVQLSISFFLIFSADIFFYFVLIVYCNYKTVYRWKYFIPCATP